MMPVSVNRYNLVTDLLEKAEIAGEDTDVNIEDKLSYYFTYLKYHSAWKEISETNIYNRSIFKGYIISPARVSISPQKETEWPTETMDLPETVVETLDNLLEYINENDLNVLFIIPNRIFNVSEMQKINTLGNYLIEKDFTFINFNLQEDLEVDYSTDFYNSSHMNVYGATKFILYLSEYLVNNYDLADHREDSDYSSWDSEYERFKEKYYDLTGKNFEDLLN